MGGFAEEEIIIRDREHPERTLVIDEDGAIAVTGVGGGGGGGAGTEYTEDAAAAANPVGTVPMLVRRDTLSGSEVSADGDNVAAKATAKGEQYVKDADVATLTGGVTETAPASDTASSGLNGRLQRIAQRLTSLITLVGGGLPTTLVSDRLKVDPSGVTSPVSAASLPLPTGAATSAKQDTLAGLVGEVQASPTANTVLDRLKAIYTALTGGSSAPVYVRQADLDRTVDGVGADLKIAGTDVAGNSGNKSAQTLRVVIATDQPALTNKLLVTPDLPSGAATDAAITGINGATSGAAVTTDANGTLQQYLRGLVTILGAVTASPVANSIGDRLKALLTGIVLATGSNIIGRVGVDQTTPGTTDRVTAGKTTLIDVTLSLDTSAYASGDVLADTQVVTGAGRANDMGGVIQSVTVVDKDDQGAAFDIWFLNANQTMGTENAAPSISDANAATILGRIQVGTSDYYDLGGVKVASLSGFGIPFLPVSGASTLYVAVVNGSGTPTYTASGVVLRIGLLQD